MQLWCAIALAQNAIATVDLFQAGVTLPLISQVVGMDALVNFESGAAARWDAALAAGIAGVGAVPLTAANFDEKMAGKSAFIKFLAPW